MDAPIRKTLWQGGAMARQRSLQVVLVLVGLLFTAAVLPVIGGLRDPAGSDTGDTMMMSLYMTLGIFLLLAARNPAKHRSLIAFTAWSSFAHALTMGTQGLEMPQMRTGFLIGSGVLVVIGVLLIVLTPARTTSEKTAVTA
jgi:tryptophan-rich sensory protein